MEGFFEELVKFINSPIARGNFYKIAGLTIGIVVLTIFVTSIVFNKWIIPVKLKKSENIMPEYQKVLAENEKLKNELNQLKNTKAMLSAANYDGTEVEKIEDWEKQFLKRK